MSARVFVSAAVAAAVLLFTIEAYSQDIFAKWLSGAKGFSTAMEKRQGTSDVVLLYFYTDWCPYCRQFNNEIVASKEMNDYLDHAIGVRINPEKGKEEQAIARSYDVTGYPTFFVLPPGSDNPQRISASRKMNPLTPSEFVRECERAGQKRIAKKQSRPAPAKEIKRERRTPTTKSLPTIPSLHPVTLYLKNGSFISGELEEETTDVITLRLEYGTITFKRSEIDRLVKGEQEAQ